MNTQDFCYWFQGFVELNGQKPNNEQWESIKEHLGLVFEKETKFYRISNSGEDTGLKIKINQDLPENMTPIVSFDNQNRSFAIFREYDENTPIHIYGRDITC